MPHANLQPAQGTVPASSTLVPGLQLSAVLGLGFVGAILVLDGGHSFDTCRSVAATGLGSCATLWANLVILAIVIALVLLPVTMMVIRVSRLRRHQQAPRLVSQPTRQAWAHAPLPPPRARFVAPPREVLPPAEPVAYQLPEPRMPPVSQPIAPTGYTPAGPSYIQPVLRRDPEPIVVGGRQQELDELKREFQAMKAQLEVFDAHADVASDTVVPFVRPEPTPVSREPAPEPTPA